MIVSYVACLRGGTIVVLHFSEEVNRKNMAFKRQHYERFFRKADKDQDGMLGSEGVEGVPKGEWL